MRKLWKHPDLTDRQATLIGKTVGQVSEEKDLEETIAGLQQELKDLEHFKICEECRIELCLNVDRYLGSRGPWYLNLQDDSTWDMGDGCPDPRKYKIGKSFQHTLKFIDDRLAWAQESIEQELKTQQDQLKTLKATRAF
jgi:hypothetical protein